MAISSKELAQKLNLSPAAVSMALNNKPGVSEKTRQLVLAAAEQYGCTVPRRQESPAGGTIQFVIYKKHGEIVNDSPFFSQLTEGINTGCRHAGFDLQISYFYEYKDRELQMKALKESGCRGIILLGTEISREFFEPFSRLSTPMVVLDTYFEELDCDSILINNVQGAFRATSYLIDNGLLKIGYLRSLYPIGNFSERADGYYKALRYHRVPAEHPYVHRLTPSVEGAYNDMKRLILDGIEIADGYFSDNDQIAAGAMRAFKEAGFRIPEDISFIGFDDMPICECMDPPLTTMAVPKHYLGELAVDRLIGKLRHPAPACIKTEISPRLLIRGSVNVRGNSRSVS